MTTTKQKIILAVANGARNTREIAQAIGVSYSTVNNYFHPQYHARDYVYVFKNGDILQWQPGLMNTLRLADGVLRHESRGRVVGVYGKVEIIGNDPNG